MFGYTQTLTQQQGSQLAGQTEQFSVNYSGKHNLTSLVLSPQVDKGVVPLAGTNGETTTQGMMLQEHTLTSQTTAVTVVH